MKKKSHLMKVIFSALAMMLGAPTGGWSQGSIPWYNPLETGKQIERTQGQRQNGESCPLVAQQRSLKSSLMQFPRTNFLAGRNPLQVVTAAAKKRIWGNVSYMPSWGNNYHIGYYSFEPSDSITLYPLCETEFPIAEFGVQIADGHIYGAYMMPMEGNQYQLYISDYDTETWTGTSKKYGQDHYDLVATETAQAEDGTVYGQFYNKSLNRRELGIVDYRTLKRTKIATSLYTYLAMGITHEGQLYGVATNGNLYKIDKETGEEELVGPTGFTKEQLVDADGYYNQTGEIDPETNIFYWAAVLLDGTCGIYTVDLTTGAATYLGQFVGTMHGMIFPGSEAHNDAPAAVENASADFVPGSLEGKINFTTPTTTYGGDPLGASVIYTIYANGEQVATGTANTGEQVSANVTLHNSGNYFFSIELSNGAGRSPKTTINQWVGFDEPNVATNVLAIADGQNISLTWTAPTEGVRNGFLGALVYDVLRVNNGTKDTTTVATNLQTTKLTDNIASTALESYTYAIITHNGDMVSTEKAFSNNVVVGNPYEPTWGENFDNLKDFRLFTVVDANGDGKTWSWNSEMFARSDYSEQTGNDDWLITPPLHMKSDRNYILSFKAKNRSANYKNTLEVMCGKRADAQKLTMPIMETTAPSGEWTEYSYEINPAESGVYYVGFHDNTAKPNQYAIDLDDIKITKGSLPTSPDSVRNVAVVAAEHGTLEATISFQVPTTTINGETLSYVDSVQIERDGNLITTLGRMDAGSLGTYLDQDVPTDGYHTYLVTCYLADEYGRGASAMSYIGQDVPCSPKNLQLHDNESTILTTWDSIAEIGANKGYVNPSQTNVSIYQIVQSSQGVQVGDLIGTSKNGATSLTISSNPEVSSQEGVQELFYVAAAANGKAGMSKFVASTPIVIGPTIYAPFKETFTNAAFDNRFAYIEGNDQLNSRSTPATWDLTVEQSSDDDNGSALWAPHGQPGYSQYTIENGDECALCLPKVSIEEMETPVLYFDYYAKAGEKAKIRVEAMRPDGSQGTIGVVDLSKGTADGWTRNMMPLQDFINNRYIVIKFVGVSEGDDTYIGLDNINVIDQQKYDLSGLKLNVPKQVTAGKEGKATLKLINLGSEEANNFDIVVYKDDKELFRQTINDYIPVLGEKDIVLSIPTKINDKGDITVKAVIDYDADENKENNSLTSTMTVTASQYPAVTSLSADATNEGNQVNLQWGNPEIAQPEEVTESFETYSPNSTDLGEWTSVCGDDGKAQNIDIYVNYGLKDTNFAFMTFNPNASSKRINVTEEIPGLTPYNGDQFAAAVYHLDKAETTTLDADNWLISPPLSGNAQNIQFFAFNYAYPNYVYKENFDVLYSTTDNDTTSFRLIEQDVADGGFAWNQGPNWKEFNIDLPQGATYFAIHHNTKREDGAYLFGIDNVTFEKGCVGICDQIIGYNLYRDGEKIESLAEGQMDYTDKNVTDGEHTYNVTVLFKDAVGNVNESPFSNDAVVMVANGIYSIAADSHGLYNVYTADGKLIMCNAKSLHGLKPGVYLINNRKYIIR